MKKLLACTLTVVVAVCALAQTKMRSAPDVKLPNGYWPIEKSGPLIEKTQTVRLAPDLSQLTAGERRGVAKLLEVGKIFQSVYEQQRHERALAAARDLLQLDRRLGSPAATQNLVTLYRLFQGPIATTLDNKREPFLPIELTPPGQSMYDGISKQEVDAYLAAHPDERDALLDQRSVVRRATVANLRRDVEKLQQYGALSTLHPGLQAELMVRLEERLKTRADAKGLYAVPYSLAYADEMIRAHGLLNEAADAVARDDWEFARYLRNRARDLLSDDYESGDAAWVTGHFKNLNAQIGAYETYDDALYGVKTFYAFSLLRTRRQETDDLRRAMRGLQALEDSLPYEHHKRVREDIPVGVYDVIADFGQARGGNTATILPNESYLARRYGRTILLRANIMRSPEIFEGTNRTWAAAIVPAQKDDLTSDGNFYRTLWHEVGHYLGVDATKTGQELAAALQDDADLLEEMKADLVSLYVAEALHKQSYYTDAQLRSVYASGILRVLQNNKPRRDQPYQTMELMQWNFFMEHGLLSFDRQTQRLRINYGKYHEVVGQMLARVFAVQYEGDKAAADRFVDEYAKWDESLHGAIAQNIRANQGARFRLFKYAALGE
ncbi:MAG: NUDIX hydrolase [Acidobacteria bacterium]|nr:MAG: NUDIX hydrolase [Acidobacteriota bacterium]